MRARTIHSVLPDLLVGFDTETTGLSTREDRAISYGFYAVHTVTGEVESHHFYVNPGIPVSPGAKSVHRIDIDELIRLHPEEVLTHEEGLARAVQLLAEYADKKAAIVGANVVGYDIEMLKSSLRNSSLGPWSRHIPARSITFIDVLRHQMDMDNDPSDRPKRGLAKLCAHYGVVPGGHNALEDARAAVEVFAAQVSFNQSHGQAVLDFSQHIS
jgi:DNA polymerase III epsilon subunit-like protein